MHVQKKRKISYDALFFKYSASFQNGELKSQSYADQNIGLAAK